jgi:hypothetical protein
MVKKFEQNSVNSFGVHHEHLIESRDIKTLVHFWVDQITNDYEI